MNLLLTFVLLTGNWEVDWSTAIRRDTTTHWLNTTMQGFTLLGNAGVECGINLGVFVLGNDSLARNVKLAAVSAGTTGVLTILLKGAINRDRPDHSSSSRWSSSFPSGHTSGYFSFATVYALKYPRLAIPLYAIGAGVAYSRIYMGKHYPTDVLAGAALGIGIGWLVVKLEPQLRRIPFLR